MDGGCLTLENRFPCKCGIPFNRLPFEFHPNGNGPYRISWYRVRGDGMGETVQLSGQANTMHPSEAYLIPGDWDMCDSQGNRFRLTVVESRFPLCTKYRPDNLKYLEEQYVSHNKQLV